MKSPNNIKKRYNDNQTQLFGNMVNIEKVIINQFPVNTNIATTDHKLYGMSKDSLIVHTWNHSWPNWIYVVLLRVRILSGIFCINNLMKVRHFDCDEDILREEKHLAKTEKDFLKDI